MASPDPPERMVRALSLSATVALVVGNMVGTSAYTLPAALAAVAGPIGILGWALCAFGYLFVARVYASLGTRHPRTGGPAVFAREAFGPFAGFQSMWSYWLSIVIGNAAIVTGVIGYITGFVPALAGSAALRFVVAEAILWGLCLLNVIGVRPTARLQKVVVLCNIVPLLVIGIAALPSFDLRNFVPFAPHGASASLAASVALVVWGYAGVETATVPAEEVVDPHRTIARGTMLGYAAGTAVFLLLAAAMIGGLSTAEIAASPRPVALLASRTLGGWAATVAGVAAIAAGLGTLNGWILVVGRVPLTATAEGVYFHRLARVHPHFGTPAMALVTGTAVTSAILSLYFFRSLLGVFQFVALLAILTTLLPHLLSAAAELRFARRDRDTRRLLVAAAAFLFILYTIYGAGPEVAQWGLLAFLAGIPLYVLLS